MKLGAIPNNRKRIASDPAPGRLNNCERHCRRNCRIDGVAAFEQHAKTGLRSQRMGGGDNVAAHHGGAGRGIRQVKIDGDQETASGYGN